MLNHTLQLLSANLTRLFCGTRVFAILAGVNTGCMSTRDRLSIDVDRSISRPIGSMQPAMKPKLRKHPVHSKLAAHAAAADAWLRAIWAYASAPAVPQARWLVPASVGIRRAG